MPVSQSFGFLPVNTPLEVTDGGNSLTVDGPLTDTQLRATAVPVSGTVTANTGLTQPLTDAQLRASSVPVSGTVGISGTVPVSGTFWQATQPVSGTITAAQTTAANLNATVVQGTATSLKTQAENYQGGSAVGSGNPLQVTLANTGSNSTAILTTNRGATGEATVSSFTSTTSATLKSSNSNRKVLTIYNEGAGNLHVLYGSGTTSTTNYSVKLFSGDYIEIDKYTGQVNAIFATAGTARVTEIT